MKIIYVAGYGRSGSTLLNVMMANLPRVRGLGEACNLQLNLIENSNCSCGQPLRQCPAWESISHENWEQAEKQRKCAEHFLGFYKWRGNKIDAYLSFWSNFLKPFAAQVDILVDTSKSTTTTVLRPMLYRRLGYPLKLVFIYKSADQLLASLSKGSNKDIEHNISVPGTPHLFLLRSYFGAAFSYLSTSIISKTLKIPLKTIMYDDLVGQPENVMAWLGLPDGKIDLEQMPVGHLASGNRFIRLSQKISLELSDRDPDRSLNTFYRKLYSTLDYLRPRDRN